MVRISALIHWRKPIILQYYFYLIGQTSVPLIGRDDKAFGLFSIEEEPNDIDFMTAGYTSACFL